MTISFGDVTVTTWGEQDGQQVWRARGGALWEQTAEFLADRTAPLEDLHRLGLHALAER